MTEENTFRAAEEMIVQVGNVISTYMYLHPELAEAAEGIFYTSLLSLLAEQSAFSIAQRADATKVPLEDTKNELITHVTEAYRGGVELALAAYKAGAQTDNVVEFKPKK